MQIETERLILRPFQPEDGEGLYEYLSDAEVVRYEPYISMSPEEAREEAGRRAKNNDFWAVCKKDGQLIGNLYFSKREILTPGSLAMYLTANTGERAMPVRVYRHCWMWHSENGMSDVL